MKNAGLNTSQMTQVMILEEAMTHLSCTESSSVTSMAAYSMTAGGSGRCEKIALPQLQAMRSLMANFE